MAHRVSTTRPGVARPRPHDDVIAASGHDAPVAYLIVKRCIDVTGALLAMIIALPLLALGVAWVFIIDGRPVFYRQWRVGEGGWLFEILKLRTMYRDAEKHGAQWARDRDDRILPGSAWLRRMHIDELPQLWNILCGDMSLVGPRPERPEMIEALRPHLPHIEQRLAAPPGLTGLAQIRRGYTNDLAGAHRKLTLDLNYLRGRGLLADLRLLMMTLPRIWDRSAL